MRLSVSAMAGAFGLLWGGAILLTAVANLAWPGYGQELLQVMASVYPGYEATASLGGVIVGTLYALVDGAIAGAVFAWLYNLVEARSQRSGAP